MTAILGWVTSKAASLLAPLAILAALIGGIYGAGRRGARVEGERDALKRDVANAEVRRDTDAAAAAAVDPAAELQSRWRRD